MLRLSIVKGWLQAKVDQRGAAMTEYALILAFVVIIASVALATNNDANNMNSFGGALKELFGDVATFLNTTQPPTNSTIK